MRHRPVVTLLMLMIAVILALPAQARETPVAPTFRSAQPFTQGQVQGMVRSGLGDETGGKAIELRGIDFVPTEDFLQSLKAAGANEAFLAALRAAKHGSEKVASRVVGRLKATVPQNGCEKQPKGVNTYEERTSTLLCYSAACYLGILVGQAPTVYHR